MSKKEMKLPEQWKRYSEMSDRAVAGLCICCNSRAAKGWSMCNRHVDLFQARKDPTVGALQFANEQLKQTSKPSSELSSWSFTASKSNPLDVKRIWSEAVGEGAKAVRVKVGKEELLLVERELARAASCPPNTGRLELDVNDPLLAATLFNAPVPFWFWVGKERAEKALAAVKKHLDSKLKVSVEVVL